MVEIAESDGDYIMTVAQMRDKVSNMYDHWMWRDRVAKMDDKQVMAIYFSTLERDPDKLEPEKKNKGVKYRQMTIFDFIN